MIRLNEIKEYYFFVYPSFRFTKGYSRAIMIDTETARINEIPIELFDILVQFNKSKISDVIKKYGIENQGVLIEYFEWLREKEVLYLSLNKLDIENFKDVSNKWDVPHEITNGILDFDDSSKSFAKERIEKILDFGIPHIELRFFCKMETKELENILEQTLKSNLNSIIIYLPYQKDNKIIDLKNIINTHLRVFGIYIYSSPNEKTFSLINNQSRIIYLKQDIIDIKNCGIVNQKYFISSADFQRESSTYNSCLNRKISIDTTGEIKNCPSMQKSYGNIKDTMLEEALNKKGFKDLWNIKKDDIKVCKDCEFRYICPDCRAYIENPKDKYSKPLKCGYDPYNGIWEEWSVNPLKQEAIEFYGMQNVI